MKSICHMAAAAICAIPVLLHPVGVTAQTPVSTYDPALKGSICIAVVDPLTEMPVDNAANVKLYRVGAPDTSGGYLSFKLTGDFINTGADLSDLSPDGETAAVGSFMAMIAATGGGAYTGGLATDGAVTFNGLEQGLYLAVYTSTGKIDGGTLIVSPFLLSVPMQDVDGAGWIYDVVSYPKYIVIPDPTPTMTPPPAPTQPVWPKPKPSGYIPYAPPPASPPTTISIPADTPAPDAPLITGTPIPPALVNLPTNPPRPTLSQPPDTNIELETPQNPFGSPNLPQTGLNQLPIPIMSALGLILIVMGIVDSRGKRRAKK